MVEVLFKTDRVIKTIDCRALLPPEPMELVLEAVELLDESSAVLMIHRKEPFPLYPKLEERDCMYEIKKPSDGTIQLLIWKSTDENR